MARLGELATHPQFLAPRVPKRPKRGEGSAVASTFAIITWRSLSDVHVPGRLRVAAHFVVSMRVGIIRSRGSFRVLLQSAGLLATVGWPEARMREGVDR